MQEKKEKGKVIYLLEHIAQRTEDSNKNKVIMWAYKDKAAAYDAARVCNVAGELDSDYKSYYKSEYKVEETLLYKDKKDITEIKFSMRDFLKENLDEILDNFFQKNILCCICQRKEKCEENAKLPLCEEKLSPCAENSNVSGENGKTFLDSPATPENIAKLKEIYEEVIY